MELTDKEKIEKYDRIQQINKKSFQRRQIRIKLIMEKAVKAGIVVTEAEIDKELAKKK